MAPPSKGESGTSDTIQGLYSHHLTGSMISAFSILLKEQLKKVIITSIDSHPALAALTQARILRPQNVSQL